MSKQATITLCADDYGLSYGVSRGIIEALGAGRLSAVSALVTGPRWPALGHELMRRGFDADIGLHLNLTLGKPLGPMPQFAKNGVFRPFATWSAPRDRASCRSRKFAPRSAVSSIASRR